MGWLKVIWEILKLLPVVISLVKQLLAANERRKEAEATEEIKKAHEQMNQAETPEEIWEANEKATRAMP